MDSAIERILRFNCPPGCDGNGSYPEQTADGEWELCQCQWCFEYGMPTRDAIQSAIRTEKLKLLAEVRERVIGEDLPPDVATDNGIGYSRQQFAINMGKAGQRTTLTKLEAEL